MFLWFYHVLNPKEHVFEAGEYVLLVNEYVFVAGEYVLAKVEHVFKHIYHVLLARQHVFADGEVRFVRHRVKLVADNARFPSPSHPAAFDLDGQAYLGNMSRASSSP